MTIDQMRLGMTTVAPGLPATMAVQETLAQFGPAQDAGYSTWSRDRHRCSEDGSRTVRIAIPPQTTFFDEGCASRSAPGVSGEEKLSSGDATHHCGYIDTGVITSGFEGLSGGH